MRGLGLGKTRKTCSSETAIKGISRSRSSCGRSASIEDVKSIPFPFLPEFIALALAAPAFHPFLPQLSSILSAVNFYCPAFRDRRALARPLFPAVRAVCFGLLIGLAESEPVVALGQAVPSLARGLAR